MNKKLRWFVTISVTLNLLLLGIVGGHILHRMNGPGHWDNAALEMLPPKRQEEFKAAMEQVRSEDDAEAMRKSRERIRTILTAPEFDGRAYWTELGMMDVVRNERKQRFAYAISTLASHWTAEERSILADLLKRPAGMKQRDH